MGIRIDLSDRVCPVCSSGAQRLVGRVVHYVEGCAPADVVECPTCESSWVAEVQRVDGLYDAIYRHARDLPGYARYDRFSEVVRDDVRSASDQRLWEIEGPYAAVKWAIDAVDGASRRVLEVGSGLGYTTAALRAGGVEAIGLDESREAVRSAVARFGEFYVASSVAEHLEENPGGYDLVIATEVIEHVVDPVSFLSDLLSLVRPTTGAVLLTTPNKDAHGRSEVWATDLPPVHLLWLGSRSLEALAAAAGASCEVWPACLAASTAVGVPALSRDLRPYRQPSLTTRLRHRLIGRQRLLRAVSAVSGPVRRTSGSGARPNPTLAGLFRR